jgi:hypothetical protein
MVDLLAVLFVFNDALGVITGLVLFRERNAAS